MSDFPTEASTAVPRTETDPSTTQTTTSNISAGVQNATNSVIDGATSAYNAAANHPFTQSVANGPVAENAKAQVAKTQDEFSNLANARQTPAEPAATGQQLTHYHSFFTSLLSWDNPRASAIAFTALVLFIFGARYLDLLRYAFKITWMTLGVTVLAETIGQKLFSTGFASQIRPKKYYVVPKETLDSMLGDVHELINFFVIEAQRIVFAENIFASATACISAFFSYYLVKIVPLWGLSLIATSVLFLVPLIYKSNKELIDHHINNASEIVNQQTAQVKEIASHHASVAAETTKQYVGDYSAKAQEAFGYSTAKAPVVKTEKTEPGFKGSDFPAAPKDEFKTNPQTATFPTAPSVGNTASTLGENEPVAVI